MKIYVNMRPGETRDSFITPKVQKRLQSLGELEINIQNKPLGGIELAEKLSDKDVLITGWGQPLIKREDLGNVKMIVHTGGTVGGIVDTGVFDTDTTVISGNRYYAVSVAEGVVGYILFALRDMAKYTAELKQGTWKYNTQTRGLYGKTVGIVSLGAIGTHMARILSAFHVKLKAYSTTEDQELAELYDIEYTSLDDIFKTCDIVTIHTANNADTYHMINEGHFKLLKNGALFVNTSRGTVIDEAALIAALKEKRFTAVLDVYEKEPLPADSELINLENAILFPHQAGPAFDMREDISIYLAEDIERFFKGQKPMNKIDKETMMKMTVSK